MTFGLVRDLELFVSLHLSFMLSYNVIKIIVPFKKYTESLIYKYECIPGMPWSLVHTIMAQTQCSACMKYLWNLFLCGRGRRPNIWRKPSKHALGWKYLEASHSDKCGWGRVTVGCNTVNQAKIFGFYLWFLFLFYFPPLIFWK